jgi:hypothetical protein
MKIALCLSGQPRSIDSGFNGLNESILKNNDVDVFIHTWFDENNLSTNSVIPGREENKLDSNAIEKLKNYYNPKKILVDCPKFWNKKYDFTDLCFVKAWTWALEVTFGLDSAKNYICNTANSMFYSIMMSNQIKNEYAINNNVEYDLVIRNRIDFSPHMILKFDEMFTEEFEDNVLIYHDLYQPDNMIADWFAMGRTNTMDIYSGVYNHIEGLIKQSNNIDGYWCNELLLKHHILNNNISIEKVDFKVHY